MLENDILLRLQLLAQFGNFAFVIIHVGIGVVLVETARQGHGSLIVPLHAILLLCDTAKIQLCEAKLLLEEGLFPLTVRQVIAGFVSFVT